MGGRAGLPGASNLFLPILPRTLIKTTFFFFFLTFILTLEQDATRELASYLTPTFLQLSGNASRKLFLFAGGIYSVSSKSSCISGSLNILQLLPIHAKGIKALLPP